MKEQIKNVLKGFPILRKFYRKYILLRDKKEALDAELHAFCRENIDLKLQLKRIKGEPIHVVFVCHRPAIWESLHSVYDAMKQDPDFRVTIVAIPNKKQLPKLCLAHEQYESEGAEEFWKDQGCINGYDYKTGQWLDLESLQPDYVFFQTPYNICKPPQYHSHEVSKYAHLAYVTYYGVLYTDDVYDECTPPDFMNDLSFFFTQNPMDDAYVRNRMKQVGALDCQVINTGFPRYDRIESYRSQPCTIWNRSDSFKMVWTPRWTTNEGNCHFFDFKDTFVDYCKQNPDVELVFRPHPQAFQEWNATGELPEAEANIYKQNFVDSNMHLDQSGNYFPMLYTSDCLITDRSTIFLDYYCSGKPIIYCTSENHHDAIFPQYIEGMYCVSNWAELEAVINDLRKGIDPLQSTRQRIIEENFIPKGNPASLNILQCIKNHSSPTGRKD